MIKTDFKSNINVKKEDGKTELFEYDKIYSHLSKACNNLNNVSMHEIIDNMHLKIYNNIKSSEIQEALIKSAVELISEEIPDYQIVAGRLLNQKIRKEAYGSYEISNTLKARVEARIKKGFYDTIQYSNEEWNIIESIIDYEIDNNLPFVSLSQMYHKYLLKNHKGKVIETPQEVFMLIHMYIFKNCKNRIELIKNGYKYISQQKISYPTPIMNGVRTSYKKWISCNLINAGDSVESIADTTKKIIQCTANKAGIGINASHIRGLGANVGSNRVKHTGILPILKAYESATASLTQIGRGGSANVNMPFYHWEIELFVQLGDTRGSVETRTRHIDQTIIINKWFIAKALNREDIYLFHPNEIPNLYNNLGNYKEFDKLYNYYISKLPKSNLKKINAYKLLELIILERSLTGRLYITFADNCYNQRIFKEPQYSTNLCCEILLPHEPLKEVASCILSNINLGYSKEEEIPEIANFLVNFLENVIDESEYSIKEVETFTKNRRALGIGVSNLFGFLALNKLIYNTKEARKKVHETIELFYYHLLKSSLELAKEKGACESFKDTRYSEGVFSFSYFNSIKDVNDYSLKLNWEELKNEILKYGLRHSTLMAVPPAANSADVSNSTSGVEPPRELITTKTDKNVMVKKIVPYYYNNKYYTTAWGEDFNNIDYFKLISNISKFVDQSISLNQYTKIYKNEKVNIKVLIEELITCFNLGIKTLYYQNFNTQGEKKDGCESGSCSV